MCRGEAALMAGEGTAKLREGAAGQVTRLGHGGQSGSVLGCRG